MSAVRLIAFYLPQFHPIPENDRAWGPGFTEWTNVVRAQPNFEGHVQPHRPGELGFYDLRDAATRLAQAELAHTHGIHGFCYYYYWFDGKRVLERPLEAVHASGAPDFPFCVCWANENWTRRWDGGGDDVILAQAYSPESDRRLFADLAPLLRDRRYIRIGERPLVLVYRANLLPDARASVARFREQARADGLPDPYLAMVLVPGMPAPAAWGFDAAVEFPPHGLEVVEVTQQMQIVNPRFAGAVWDYVSAAKSALAKPTASYRLFRGVMAGWDNTPRLQNNGHAFVNAHPENYRRWLTALVAQAHETHPPEERIVFVNAWNEWAEGCYLEPDREYGRAYLEATRRALEDGMAARATAPGPG